MKVGTDGVLLGAWCRIDPESDKVLLDLGTGTGLIALQLAQRTESIASTAKGGLEAGVRPIIEAVEIDSAACESAGRNFAASSWADRLRLHCMSVQEFADQTLQKFDHIVSNPPYFADSLPSPDLSRTTARHTSSLSYEEFISVSDRLLQPDGRISLILPAPTERDRMIAVASAHGFRVSHRTEVYTTPRSGPKRTLMEFSRLTPSRATPANTTETSTITALATEAPAELMIHDANLGGAAVSSTFSSEYRTLTRDFYLHF